MNTAEIKNDLHKLIVETDDFSILSKIQAYFSTLRSKKIDWWDTISANDKKNIEISEQQIQKGEGIPHDQARKRINKLLSK